MFISSIHIFVKDLAAALEFYEITLGIPVKLSTPDFFILDTGQAELMVFGVEDAPPEQTCIHFQVEDLPSLYDRLLAAGVHFHGAPQVHDWGGMMVDFSDPHGNRLHFVQLLRAGS